MANYMYISTYNCVNIYTLNEHIFLETETMSSFNNTLASVTIKYKLIYRTYLVVIHTYIAFTWGQMILMCAL